MVTRLGEADAVGAVRLGAVSVGRGWCRGATRHITYVRCHQTGPGAAPCAVLLPDRTQIPL